MSTKKPHMELSKRLKKVRKGWNLSQAVMAERLKIATSTYQYYERGERDLPSSLLIKITTFGVNPTWLLTGQGEILIEKENKMPEVVEKSDNVTEIEHMNMIKGFKDKTKAKKMNELLIELEDLNEVLFDNAGTYLLTTVNAARQIAGKSIKSDFLEESQGLGGKVKDKKKA